MLSLFDGMSGARLALDRAGVPVAKYYASEVDKYAMQVAQANYPDTVQLGDVTKLKGKKLPAEIDLLVGGSPCQNLSALGRMEGVQSGLEGEKSKLFFEYLRILKKLKPKYFLLENVASMKPDERALITEKLGVEPVEINSKDFSAQSRNRLYWTNLPFAKSWEKSPVKLQDVLEPGAYTERDKSVTLNTSQSSARNYLYARLGQMVFTTPVSREGAYWTFAGKTHYFKKHKFESEKAQKARKHMRTLTRNEMEALQTVPKDYTKSVSRTQATKMLGNGFTVDVIAHIFEPLKKKPKKS